MTLVGVLDSGVGGLSVLRELHAVAPHLSTLYYADQSHLPYGERDHAALRRIIDPIAAYLIEKGAAALVLACHAASAASLHDLRRQYPTLPIIGIEPAVKPAAERTHSGVIGVVTTRATAQSDLYRDGVRRYARHVRVITQVAPEWVTLVEADTAATVFGQHQIMAVIDMLLANRVDQIALACTHFPFLAAHIAPLIAGRAALVDPGPAVAVQTVRRLAEMCDPAAPPQKRRTTVTRRYVTSGDVKAFVPLVRRLLDDPTISNRAFSASPLPRQHV